MSTENIDGELNYSTQLTQQLEKLYLNSNHSDVTFVVDGIKLPAHKVILNMRSSYFEALTNGGFSESSKSEIELKVPLKAFKHVLRYIYTGRASFQSMDYQTAIDLLGLAETYFFEELKSGVASYLMNNLSMKNCCDVFEAANLYELSELKEATLEFMGRNANEVLKTDKFKTLTSDSLHSLLAHSTFIAPEIDIFKAVVEWRKHNQNVEDDDFQLIISEIRFELIDWEDLLSVCRGSSVLSAERLLDVIQTKAITKTLNYRFICKPGLNVATTEFNAKVISGEHPLELLNGNFTQYDDNNGYTYHSIFRSNENCILVELEHIFMINKLEMLLWDRDNRSYFYYVEVSTNQKQWTRTIDHTKYNCRSWQHLYFEKQPVRYIKIVGTDNTENNHFHVVHLAAYYEETIPTLIGGLTSPAFNVATIENGAKVIKGSCFSNDTLDVVLNGDVTNYTGVSGYTEHMMRGEECIIIQLAQPYHIGSLRLLLWDRDDRTYSFFIETSTNPKNWNMAVDNRNERLRSWQEFTFEARPVIFFKITGTINSRINNNAFHLVHFEAPSTSIKN